jgi:hypothetical protein
MLFIAILDHILIAFNVLQKLDNFVLNVPHEI